MTQKNATKSRMSQTCTAKNYMSNMLLTDVFIIIAHKLSKTIMNRH